MILTALNDYYKRLLSDPDSGIAEPGYSLEKISYAIVIDKGGYIVAVDDIRDASGKKPAPKGMIVPASFKRPGVGSKPFFLWDKTSYSLGVGKDKERAKQNHEAFKDLHKNILVKSGDPALKALLTFLDKWTPEQFQSNPHLLQQSKEMLDTNIVFRLDGEQRYLHESPEVRLIWAEIKGSDKESDGFCLVVGKRSKISRIHPAIKGIKGTDKAETSIVSFNNSSFESYGKNQGHNAPVSEVVADAYVTALNHLLRSKRQRIDIGDANVVFWAQADDSKQAQAAEDLFSEFINPKDEDAQHIGRLRDVLEKVRQGLPLSSLKSDLKEDTQIFVLGLAPNASRLSIRFWETGSLKMFAERLAAHYEDLRLEPPAWSRPPSIGWLAKVTGPYRKSKDGKRGEYDSDAVSPLLAGELARSVLTGSRYPQSLLANLIMRMRADGEISDIRVALCKGVLARAARLNRSQGNLSNKGELPVSLDTNNTDPGYLLGRLFSVLENIQKAALGKDINATIRDRFYGAASATPASVFPVLVRNAQHHLSRLRKDKPGFAVNLENDIGDILDLFGTSFPKSMGLEAQGHFTIGYYHQTKARFAEKGAQEVNEDTNESEGESV